MQVKRMDEGTGGILFLFLSWVGRGGGGIFRIRHYVQEALSCDFSKGLAELEDTFG